MDASGTRQWDKTFGGSSDDRLSSLQQTSDGGYFLGGYSRSGISGDKTEGSKGFYDYWIVKVDASGNKQWNKTLGGSSPDELTSLQQTSDGGYLLGGYSTSGISGDKTEDSKGSADYWIIKLCTQRKTYYRDADGDGYGNAAVTTQDCAPPSGYVADSTDCDDGNAAINPATVWYKDADGDGYSNGTTLTQCTRPAGYKLASELTATSGDCDDTKATVHPGATEVCGNGIDDNCNGQVDEGCTLPPLTVTIKPASALEGNSGKHYMYFTLQLNRPAPGTCEVTYETHNGTAKAGSDYQSIDDKEVSFCKGQTSKTIGIYVYGDRTVEKDETFTVELEHPRHVKIAGSDHVTGTIINDDYGHNNTAELRADLNEQEEAPVETLVVPNLLHRSQVWRIPSLPANNQVVVIDVNGRVILQVRNYQNGYSFSNAAAGIYFYQIQTTDNDGKPHVYKGKLLITD